MSIPPIQINNTFATLAESVKNNVRRLSAEYLQELSTIINDAQDEICQRKRYWFLEVYDMFHTADNPSEPWHIVLPTGAGYSTIVDDIAGVWWMDEAQNMKPLEYLPYHQAIVLYYIPGANQTAGMPEVYSETENYDGIYIFPNPLQDFDIYMKWTARSLPDWDGSSQTATNILVQQYANVMLEWSVALSWKFHGMSARYQERLQYAEALATRTLDREDVRKRWQRIKTLPQRKDLSIPRQQQVSPFRTPPWVLP